MIDVNKLLTAVMSCPAVRRPVKAAPQALNRLVAAGDRALAISSAPKWVLLVPVLSPVVWPARS